MQTPTLFHDDPVTGGRPLWPSLGGLVDRLTGILPGTPASSPVLISGDWGSGKTSLLRSVQDRMSRAGQGTVWFDAWHYEGESALLPALLRKVWESTPEPFRKKDGAIKRFRVVWRCALAATSRVAPFIAA